MFSKVLWFLAAHRETPQEGWDSPLGAPAD